MNDEDHKLKYIYSITSRQVMNEPNRISRPWKLEIRDILHNAHTENFLLKLQFFLKQFFPFRQKRSFIIPELG